MLGNYMKKSLSKYFFYYKRHLEIQQIESYKTYIAVSNVYFVFRVKSNLLKMLKKIPDLSYFNICNNVIFIY